MKKFTVYRACAAVTPLLVVLAASGAAHKF